MKINKAVFKMIIKDEIEEQMADENVSWSKGLLIKTLEARPASFACCVDGITTEDYNKNPEVPGKVISLVKKEIMKL